MERDRDNWEEWIEIETTKRMERDRDNKDDWREIETTGRNGER